MCELSKWLMTRLEGRRGRTNATKLKKFTSNVLRHSSGVLSAIRFTGDRVPWLRMRPSSVLKALRARETAFGPDYVLGQFKIMNYDCSSHIKLATYDEHSLVPSVHRRRLLAALAPAYNTVLVRKINALLATSRKQAIRASTSPKNWAT